MYPEYQLIQIVETPENGDNKYAVRFLARMNYFDFDFMCKNTLKKFLRDGDYKSGEYLIISENENLGDRYIVEAVCIYRSKDNGYYIDFKLAGDEWKKLVKEVMEESPFIEPSLKIQTMHKVSVQKIVEE